MIIHYNNIIYKNNDRLAFQKKKKKKSLLYPEFFLSPSNIEALEMEKVFLFTTL